MKLYKIYADGCLRAETYSPVKKKEFIKHYKQQGYEVNYETI